METELNCKGQGVSPVPYMTSTAGGYGFSNSTTSYGMIDPFRYIRYPQRSEYLYYFKFKEFHKWKDHYYIIKSYTEAEAKNFMYENFDKGWDLLTTSTVSLERFRELINDLILLTDEMIEDDKHMPMNVIGDII